MQKYTRVSKYNRRNPSIETFAVDHTDQDVNRGGKRNKQAVRSQVGARKFLQILLTPIVCDGLSRFPT